MRLLADVKLLAGVRLVAGMRLVAGRSLRKRDSREEVSRVAVLLPSSFRTAGACSEPDSMSGSTSSR